MSRVDLDAIEGMVQAVRHDRDHNTLPQSPYVVAGWYLDAVPGLVARLRAALALRAELWRLYELGRIDAAEDDLARLLELDQAVSGP